MKIFFLFFLFFLVLAFTATCQSSLTVRKSNTFEHKLQEAVKETK